MLPDLNEVTSAIDAAAGRRPGSILLKNARLINVLTGEIYPTDILLHGRLVAGTGDGYAAEQVIDLEGRYLCPGLIDGHLHLESALVEPREYARAVVPRGVTGVVCDPHEIANVAGMAGVEYMLGATEGLPFTAWFTASSCVPATALETSGAHLGVGEIDQLLRQNRVVGVAELMNFPGIVSAEPEEVAKALLADQHRKVADGHSPLLMGKRLNAYLTAGISSDHESSNIEEGRQKLRGGMTLMIREGSAARNLDALLPLVTREAAHQICWATDDRHPHDLMDDGGVDHLVRRAIQAGVDPVLAIRLGSLNTARHFRLARRGAVAPGWFADLVVLEDLNTFKAKMVFKEGRLVARDGELLEEAPRYVDSRVLDTVRLPDLTPSTFAIPDGGAPVRVIGLVPGELLTREVILAPKTARGMIVADPERDLAKLAVIERHGRAGRIGLGLVQGFGLKRGAIASTVGHDSHNLLVAGADDTDMLLAARMAAAMGGGFVCVADGQELARLPLPIAGLISDEPLEAVRGALDQLEEAARQLGITAQSPFMTLSFLALPVIPELKLTDLGLVRIDHEGLRLVGLHVGAREGIA